MSGHKVNRSSLDFGPQNDPEDVAAAIHEKSMGMNCALLLAEMITMFEAVLKYCALNRHQPVRELKAVRCNSQRPFAVIQNSQNSGY